MRPLARERIGEEEKLANHRQETKNRGTLCAGMLLGLVTPLSTALAQVATSSEFTAPPVQSSGPFSQTQSPPPTLTLLDALARAQRNDPQFQSAVYEAKHAHENRLQSRAPPLPSPRVSSQY